MVERVENMRRNGQANGSGRGFWRDVGGFLACFDVDLVVVEAGLKENNQCGASVLAGLSERMSKLVSRLKVLKTRFLF